jgi:hypothetical protein
MIITLRITADTPEARAFIEYAESLPFVEVTNDDDPFSHTPDEE